MSEPVPQTTPQEIIRAVLDEFLGQPNTPDVQEAIARRLKDLLAARPYVTETDDALRNLIALAESWRAFGDEDTWVNEKVAGLRAEQEARRG